MTKVPTMTYIPDSVLTKVKDIIGYQVLFFLNNPGFTSTLYKDHMMSFRGMITKYNKNPNALRDEVSSSLSTIFKRLFPDMIIEVRCEIQKLEGIYVKLTLSIEDENGHVLLPTSTFHTDDETGTIKLTALGE